MADSEPPHNYTVRAESTDPGVGHAETKTTHIPFDRSWGGEPSPTLPGPAELLASAFGACVIKNVERFSQLLPFTYESAAIDVDIHRADEPPRFDRIDYVLTIATTEPPNRVDLLARNLSKYGTVYNTLAAACEVSGRIDVVPPTEPTVTG